MDIIEIILNKIDGYIKIYYKNPCILVMTREDEIKLKKCLYFILYAKVSPNSCRIQSIFGLDVVIDDSKQLEVR